MSIFHRHKWTVVGHQSVNRINGGVVYRIEVVIGLACECGKRDIIRAEDVSLELVQALYPVGGVVRP